MNKDELNKICDEVYNRILKNEYSDETLLRNKISEFISLKEKSASEISNTELCMFFYFENIAFTKNYVKEVLSEILLDK